MHSRSWTREFIEVLADLRDLHALRAHLCRRSHQRSDAIHGARGPGGRSHSGQSLRLRAAPRHTASPAAALPGSDHRRCGDLRPARSTASRSHQTGGGALRRHRGHRVKDLHPQRNSGGRTVGAVHRSADLARRSIDTTEQTVRDNLAPLDIPDDHLFCLGDNRDESQDSRVFGPVPRSTIRGRALLVYWSFDNDDRASARGLGRLFYTPLNFFSKTRWDRQFTLVRFRSQAFCYLLPASCLVRCAMKFIIHHSKFIIAIRLPSAPGRA